MGVGLLVVTVAPGTVVAVAAVVGFAAAAVG